MGECAAANIVCSKLRILQKVVGRKSENSAEYAEVAALFRKMHFDWWLGKDEVASSNLASSSTKTRCPARDSGFLLFLEVVSIGKKD